MTCQMQFSLEKKKRKNVLKYHLLKILARDLSVNEYPQYAFCGKITFMWTVPLLSRAVMVEL